MPVATGRPTAEDNVDSARLRLRELADTLERCAGRPTLEHLTALAETLRIARRLKSYLPTLALDASLIEECCELVREIELQAELLITVYLLNSENEPSSGQ